MEGMPYTLYLYSTITFKIFASSHMDHLSILLFFHESVFLIHSWLMCRQHTSTLHHAYQIYPSVLLLLKSM